jgi:hypothetical protein
VYIELVVEALLIVERERKYDGWIILPIPPFSWFCTAESVTASPTVSPISICQVDTETRPIFNKFEVQARGSRAALTENRISRKSDVAGW